MVGAVAPSDLDIEDFDLWPHQHWVPANVARVIIGVAQAYGAQFPARLADWHVRSVFDHAQSEWVAREIEFVGSVIDDEPVAHHAAQISRLARAVSASQGALVLVFEGQ